MVQEVNLNLLQESLHEDKLKVYQTHGNYCDCIDIYLKVFSDSGNQFRYEIDVKEQLSKYSHIGVCSLFTCDHIDWEFKEHLEIYTFQI